MHDFGTAAKANQATRIAELASKIDPMSVHMANLEAENGTHHKEARNAQMQLQFCDTMRCTHDDKISALAGMVTDLKSLAEWLSSSGTRSTAAAMEEDIRRRESLANAEAQSPNAHKDMNDGKRRQFKWCCWKCGCDCTHSTKSCCDCTPDEKSKFKLATVCGTLGGNSKFLGCHMKCQIEFNFDSL